ncbi:MAG TPA: PAS domain S-box protein [Kouleothrix sp.]|uniref:PAS domain S-box protein n=1 Tax=Kouleothrix sp. TaxID=2779161 RepID=UPI002BEC2BA3|nr:PAS domain S-box protein [Kouleothrix sp.]
MRNRLRRWLSDATAHNLVDRQKAAYLRVMLIGLGTLGLMGTPLSLLAPLSPLQHALTISADLLLSVFMLVGLLVLRSGRLHVAVMLATCGLLVPLAITFVVLGPDRGNLVLIAFALPVALAGLLSGRNSVIFAITASLVIVASMILFSAPPGLPSVSLPAWIVVCVFALVLVLLGLFLDRFGATFYQMLNVMAAREHEIEQNRAALEQRTAALEREIVERERIEAALRQSEDKFRALVTHSPVGIFQTTAGGAYLFVNRQWCDLAGMAPAAALGQGWARALHPADARRVLAAWQQAIAGGHTFAQEYRFVQASGDVRWVFGTADPQRAGSGEVLGYFGIISDITENKHAREALRESEERYRLITENTNDLINLFDLDPSPTRVYASPSYARVLGYEQPALQFINHFDLVHPDDLPLLFEQFNLLNNGRPSQITVRLRHADGSWRWVETHATVLARDNHHYAVTVGRDITDRKRLEAQFLQAQKMESIGQLAGGIAHDFNNLLTAILGNTEMALEVLPPEHTARVDVGEIRKAADRAVGLTRQLLAFARKQIIEPHVIDLNRLILDMDALLRRLLGEDIELATLTGKQLWRVKGDPSQIEQVVINLAVNARDAMPSGGKLMIETANMLLEHDPAERHAGLPPGRYVMLAVTDTGVGMNEETQRRVFEPFFTTKPKGRGTGLGLATCYGIVKQHGGNIWLYSEVDQGTSFKIYLPGIDEPAEDPRPLIVPQELPRGHETILLVEDEAAVRALAARILRAHGYQVIEAAQGREALSIIEARPNTAIDLLLTDVVMPQMGGRMIAEHLQGRYPDLKVLYISGYTDNAIVQHGRLKPGVSFLHKPFTPVALVRKVRDVLSL